MFSTRPSSGGALVLSGKGGVVACDLHVRDLRRELGRPPVVVIRGPRAARMPFKPRLPQRRQLVNSAAALIESNMPNPSPARAPADRPEVKRVRCGSEQFHEPNLVFPRPSQLSGNFHSADLPANYDP